MASSRRSRLQSLLNHFSQSKAVRRKPAHRSQFPEQLEIRALLAAGVLDTSFSGVGQNITNFGQLAVPAAGEFYGLALQSDGKAIVIGNGVTPFSSETATSGDYQFAISRLNTDGSLDTSFGLQGFATVGEKGQSVVASSAAIQSDGKIVVAGTMNNASFFVARFNANGQLDTSFATNGWRDDQFAGAASIANSVAIQSDGRIVVGGSIAGGPDRTNFLLVRYTADGKLDTTFDGDGSLATSFDPNSALRSAIHTVLIDSNGKILAAGTATSGADFALARYNADGSLDTTFTGSGTYTSAFIAGSAGSRRIALQSDGKIVAAGFASNGIGVLRLNPDGTPDNSFNTNGRAVTSFSRSLDNFNVGIDSTGRITAVAGRTVDNSNITGDVAIARFTAAGQLDTTFDGDGKATPIFSSQSIAAGFAILSDGSLLLAGSEAVTPLASTPNVNRHMLVVKFGADGAVATGFGRTGRVSTPIQFADNTDDVARGMVLQSDGKFVVVGLSGTRGTQPGLSDFAVARYNANGSLDKTFGGTGHVRTAVGTGDDIANAVAVQSDGKIVVVGSATSANGFQFAIVRYNTDGTLDTTFNSTGKVFTSFGTGNSAAQGVEIDATGKIVVAGYRYTTSSELVVARYNPDGTLDGSFTSQATVPPAISVAEPNNDQGSASPLGAVLGTLSVPNLTITAGDEDWYQFQLTSTGSSGSFVSINGSGANSDLDIHLRNASGQIIRSSGSWGSNEYISLTGLPAGAYFIQVFGFLNSTGTYDLTVQTGAATPSDNIPLGVTLQADGKILISGSSSGSLSLTRYNADGTKDNPFGTSGSVVNPASEAPSGRNSSVVLDSNGKIVVATSTGVFRYNTNGTPDTTFNGTGANIESPSGGKPAAVRIDSSGRIITAEISGRFRRLNADGTVSLQTAFGLPGGGQLIAIQADGRFLVVGSQQAGFSTDFDFLATRYSGFDADNPNGRMYRAYNPNADYHFFTTSTAEFVNAVQHGYHDETNSNGGFVVPVLPGGAAVPVYRLYNIQTGRHYYTYNAVERDSLVNIVPLPPSGPDTRTTGWRYEKDEGYIFSSQVAGTTEIYRLYNQNTGVHLYTEDPVVKDAVLAIVDGNPNAKFPHPWVQHSSFGFAYGIRPDGQSFVGNSPSPIVAPLLAPLVVATTDLTGPSAAGEASSSTANIVSQISTLQTSSSSPVGDSSSAASGAGSTSSDASRPTGTTDEETSTDASDLDSLFGSLIGSDLISDLT